MKKLSEFSVKKPITIIMAVLIVIILGAVSFFNTTTNLFPSINLPYISISTPYIGASPYEVESNVTSIIEQSIATTSNIKNITSTSSEHHSLVFVEFNADTNMDSALIELREKLDIAEAMTPDGVGSSTIIKITPDMMPIMVFSIQKEGLDPLQMNAFIDTIKPRLESIPGVGQVSFQGLVETEIRVILDQEKIEKLNIEMNEAARKMAIQELVNKGVPLNLAEKKVPQDLGIDIPLSKEMINGILQGQNFKMPIGYIYDEDVEYLLRIGDEITSFEELQKLEIMVTDFKTVTLEEVASVELFNKTQEQYSKVNGNDVIMVEIQKQGEFAISEVSKNVTDELKLIENDYEDVTTTILMNQSDYIESAVGSVSSNLIYGSILAICVLLIFLRDLRPTFIIALAIPISVMTAFIMIYFTGITLNIISMGGLALGIGMLVDNSIVVIENIFRLRSKGVSVKKAAIKGASQVSNAILASTLTTITVFVPVIFMKGFIADIFIEMALVITFSLLASLVISLSLVPMLASGMLKTVRKVEDDNLSKNGKRYVKLVNFALNYKFLTLLTVFVLFGSSVFLALSRGVEFFPESDSDVIMGSLEIERGLEFDEVAEILDRAVDKIMTIEDIDIVSASIQTDFKNALMGMGSNSLYINIKESSKLSNKEITKTIEDKLDEIGLSIKISNQQSGASAMIGNGIQIKVKGYDYEKLESITTQIEKVISNIEGTKNIETDINKSAPEYKITIDREKAIAKGYTTAQTFMSVSELLKTNQKATDLFLNGSSVEVYVFNNVEDAEDIKLTEEDINNYIITTPSNEKIKLSDIATINKQLGYDSIKRENQSRTLTVSIEIEEGYNVGLVGQEVYQQVDKIQIPSGYVIEKSGEFESTMDSQKDLLLALGLAVILIYMVMASQFQSLLLPFIVMFTIPLAFTGGFLALFILNIPISIVASVGLIILSGVVVNNGIVLVDYINQLRETGIKKRDAIIIGGITRMRPIIMTAFTTILALTTMAIGVGEGAEMMKPLAITSIGGLIYATFLTLIIIPIMYDLLTREKVQDK